MTNIPNRISYKGFLSPAPGDLVKEKRIKLAHVYGNCRASSVEQNPSLQENKENKSMCSAIAWKAVKKK